jgi:hypothetical protein
VKKATVKKATAKKTTAKKATAKKAAKPAVKKAAAKKAVKPDARKVAARKVAAKDIPAKKLAAKKLAKPAAKQAARSPSRKTAASITPRRALANTRELLASKQARDRQAQPWQSLDPTTSHVPDAGFQSPEAKARSGQLHAAESRMAGNHGSVGARDRHAQGRRDHRGDTD